MGAIKDSNPQEMKAFTEYAEKAGVEVKKDTSNIGYSPGLKKGEPGQLFVSENDSYGAWKHEMQHLYDDEKAGWMGFSGLMDVERRSEMEYNAYKQEIEIARQIGRDDIVKQLTDLCKEEIDTIGGKWDERKLK